MNLRRTLSYRTLHPICISLAAFLPQGLMPKTAYLPERLIKQHGVANWERARIVARKLEDMETDEQRSALWQEYTRKKIITDDVGQQVKRLLGL